MTVRAAIDKARTAQEQHDRRIDVQLRIEGGAVTARQILVHLSVTVPDDDGRDPNEIADALLGALEVGSDDDSVRDLDVICPLAEEA